MRTKIVSLFLAAVMLFSLLPTALASDAESILEGFQDLPAKGSWSYPGIAYCVENGYMNGMSDTSFGPGEPLSRGQLVTILYRIQGQPETSYTGRFEDVPQEKYYALPVEWAASNAIVNGTDETHFDPESNITRQQIAAIIHRFCGNPSTGGSISSFPDHTDCQDYSVTPLSWCVENGLINGVNENGTSYLRPQETSSREQIATILMRLIQKVLDPVPSDPEETEPTVSENDYLQAYAQILRGDLTDCYQPRFHLGHIDEDAIPELIISTSYVSMAAARVYTYCNGEAVEVGNFGSMGEFNYVAYGNLINDSFINSGRSFQTFYQIKDGEAVELASFFNNQASHVDDSIIFLVDDIEVTQEAYENALSVYLDGYTWTDFDYDDGAEINESNITLMLSDPENFMIEP